MKDKFCHMAKGSAGGWLQVREQNTRGRDCRLFGSYILFISLGLKMAKEEVLRDETRQVGREVRS